MEIDRALTDQRLLGAALGDAESWSTWLWVLRGAYGLSLREDQQQTFASVAGARAPPTSRVRELWAVVARRCGKSRMAAALAVYAACFIPHKLAAGETGMVLVLAASAVQARTVFQYCLGFLKASPVLSREITDVTRNEIRLRNNTAIAIHSNSFRSIRGRTLLACVFDEIAFWRDETSAIPDVETYRAVLPALATTNGTLIAISTPYRKLGLLHQKHRDHFGTDDPDVLVVQGTAAEFNPTLSSAVIAAQRQADPQGAVSEWDAEFRSDISAFLSDELIEASINHGRPLELPPQSGVSYKAFVDASAGRGDAYTIAIGHRDKGRLVIDAVRGQHVPHGAHSFDPMQATKQFADLVKQYRVGSVVGDNYSGEWVAGAWKQQTVSYIKSELTKSEIYLECLPLFTRGLVSLPDHPRLIKELRLLERRVHRSGKDSVDHGRAGHDDYANAVCGVLRSLAFASFDSWDAAYGDGEEQPSAIYTEFADKLVDALVEAKAVDAEVHAVMHQKPYHLWESNNDGRGLPTVECAARGLTGVSPDFSLMTMKLPAFDKPKELAWPPYEVPLAVQVVAAMVPFASDPRLYTDRWHEVQAERAQAARAKAQREQEQRQAEIDANYHGPRWWEKKPA